MHNVTAIQQHFFSDEVYLSTYVHSGHMSLLGHCGTQHGFNISTRLHRVIIYNVCYSVAILYAWHSHRLRRSDNSIARLTVNSARPQSKETTKKVGFVYLLTCIQGDWQKMWQLTSRLLLSFMLPTQKTNKRECKLVLMADNNNNMKTFTLLPQNNTITQLHLIKYK